MKMLVHRTANSQALPFDLDDVKLHLRVADDAENDAITNIALTAAAEIEHFAQIAFLTQTIRVSIFDPVLESGLHLPIGPGVTAVTPIEGSVTAVTPSDWGVTAVTLDGEAFTDFTLVGGIRPYIHWKPSFFDRVPHLLEIDYLAGFGPDASHVPDDLSQALMDQAALHYDGRSPMDAKSLTTSPHMARIGARYRGVRA